MLGLLLKAIPLFVTAGGLYTAIDDSNPMIIMAKSTLTQHEVSAISRTILYRSFKKDVPTPDKFGEYLRKHMDGSRDVAIDMWGSPYILRRKGKAFTTISCGPDKKADTEDDIQETVTVIK